MIATSAEYKASIAKRTKRRTYGKVEIDFTDPFVDQSISVNTIILATEDDFQILTEDGYLLEFERDASTMTYVNQVADGIYEPTANWFPLDGSAVLDGSFVLMPPGDDAYYEPSMETGWWSDDVSGALGAFASAQVLTVCFSERPIESLLVCSDTIKHEYPVDFTIKLYDVDDALLYTETVTGNALEYWTKNITAVSGVACQELSITKWSHVGRCAKIYEFYTSIRRTYLSNSIFSMELLEERDPESSSIPIGNISANQFSVKLLNFARQFDYGSGSAIANLIKPLRKLTPYIGAMGAGGEIEWIPLGVFWSAEWDVPDDDIYASTVGYDVLDLMSRTSYAPGLLTNQTLYSIIENAFIDFGLSSTKYFIDPALNSILIPYAYIEKTTHRETVRIASEAGLASVFSDRYGVLRVEGPDYLRANKTTSERTITASEYYSRSNPSRFAQVKNIINVNSLPYAPADAATPVYQNTEVVVPAGATNQFTVFYTESPVVDPSASLLDPPSGVSITASEYYSWGAKITITNTTAADVTVELDIDAQVLSVSGGTQVSSTDSASISEFGDIEYDFPDNALVQTRAQAQSIADKILSAYSNARRDLTQEWRGDPALELGDRITTDTSRTATDFFWLIRQTITWDGTLRVSHDAINVPQEYILMTEDGYLLETEDGYLLETE